LLTYEFAGRVDKSHDFYPKWMNEWSFFIVWLKVNNPWWCRNEGTILKLKMESVKQNVQSCFLANKPSFDPYSCSLHIMSSPEHQLQVICLKKWLYKTKIILNGWKLPFSKNPV
jgi:hypothetical protein